MAYTEQDIIALKQAIATGANRVEYHDKVVWYRTLADMLRILKIMTREVYGYVPGCNRRYMSVTKGTKTC